MSFTITGITQATNAVVTVNTTGSNPFSTGNIVGFAAVVGMTQINGTNGTVVATGGSSGVFTCTVNINSTAYTAYSSGGTATILTGVAISALPSAATLVGNEPVPVDQGLNTVQTKPYAFSAQGLTTAESSLSVTPSFWTYRVTPKIDPRRYGAKGDGTTDDTTAMQTALNVMKAGNGRILLPENFNALCQPLSLTFSGNRFTTSIAIEGASPNGSKLTAKNATGPLISILGSTPTANPTECPLVFENFSVNGFSTSADLILFKSIGYFRVSGVFFTNPFGKGLNCLSALTGIVDQGCSFDGGNYHIYARQNSTGSPPNFLRIDKNVFGGAATYAIDFDQGDELQLTSNDIETNAAAIHIGGNINAATGFGYASVIMEKNWIEANTTGWTIQVDAPALGQQTDITISGGHCVNSPAGQALRVQGATRLTIDKGFKSPSPGDIWNLTATEAFLQNVIVSTLTDTGIVYPTYINVQTSTQNFRNGRGDTFASTLTGVSGGTTTGNQAVNLQGDLCSIYFVTPMSGTSGSTASPTITGLASKYWPANDFEDTLVCIDGSQSISLACSISASTGVITLGVGHSFAASGLKGISGGKLSYEIA